MSSVLGNYKFMSLISYSIQTHDQRSYIKLIYAHDRKRTVSFSISLLHIQRKKSYTSVRADLSE
jgi:hypothetical protein